MKPLTSPLPALFVIVTLTPTICLSENPEEKWWESQPEEKALDVNSGELEFLAPPPADPVHHHQNRITIGRLSLSDGWIGLKQCHKNLDPVPRTEIVFRKGGIRNLRITAAENISRAEVQGPTVQLWDVEKGARLCLEAESRALFRRDGAYILRNGPYMRRFFDGYYPMHVTLSVRWPEKLVGLQSVSPAPRPGLEVDTGKGRAKLEVWFRGRLITELGFFAR